MVTQKKNTTKVNLADKGLKASGSTKGCAKKLGLECPCYNKKCSKAIKPDKVATKALPTKETEERNYKASLVLGKTIAHARRIEAYCEVLYKALESILDVPKSSHKILMLAARLHDIGWIYGQSKHHKNVAKIIYNYAKRKEFIPENDSIDSFLQREVESFLAKNLNKVDKETALMIACVARYHRKSVPRNSHSMYKKLSAKNKVIVQKLSSVLRIADALDYSHLALVKNLKVEVNDNVINLILECNNSCNAEKQRVDVKKQPFQELTKKIVECTILLKTKD